MVHSIENELSTEKSDPDLSAESTSNEEVFLGVNNRGLTFFRDSSRAQSLHVSFVLEYACKHIRLILKLFSALKLILLIL